VGVRIRTGFFWSDLLFTLNHLPDSIFPAAQPFNFFVSFNLARYFLVLRKLIFRIFANSSAVTEGFPLIFLSMISSFSLDFLVSFIVSFIVSFFLCFGILSFTLPFLMGSFKAVTRNPLLISSNFGAGNPCFSNPSSIRLIPEPYFSIILASLKTSAIFLFLIVEI